MSGLDWERNRRNQQMYQRRKDMREKQHSRRPYYVQRTFYWDAPMGYIKFAQWFNAELEKIRMK